MPTIPTLLELADVFNVQAADIIRELENARRRKPVTVQPLPETEEAG
jgi:hypothetical protein